MSDPYDGPGAPEPEQETAPAPSGDSVTFRTVLPVTEFKIPDHDISISHYGTSVPTGKADDVRKAAASNGVRLIESE